MDAWAQEPYITIAPDSGQAVRRIVARHKLSMFDPGLLGPALVDALRKLVPRIQWRNPPMVVVYVGSILTTVLWAQALRGHGEVAATCRAGSSCA